MEILVGSKSKWRPILRDRELKQARVWEKVESFFRYYEMNCSLTSCKLFVFREGCFLLIRFILLYASFTLVDNQLNFFNAILVLIGLYFLFDVVMVNTSISFVTMGPINNLRSFLFTFFTFTHIIVAFGIFYKFVQEQFASIMCDSQVLYFSTVTITTLGYGDFVPSKSGTIAQTFVILEVLTGLFFITGVFARIISKNPSGKDGK
jgi:voltage-gated potassium channel